MEKKILNGQNLNNDEISKLKSLYLDPTNPAGFSSARNLYLYAKKLIPRLTYHQVKSFLTNQHTYTSFRKANYKFARRKVELGTEIDDTWAVDVAFELGLSGSNSSYKYFLLCIDITTKFIWTYPTKTKLASEMQNAFREIVAQNHGKAPRWVGRFLGCVWLISFAYFPNLHIYF